MTQYGEDNPDEDFFEGTKFMAMKILDREARTQNVEIEQEEKTWEYIAAKNPKKGDCQNFEDCDDWEDCDGVECRKSYCDRCGRYSSSGACECPCATGKCVCYGSDSEEDNLDNSKMSFILVGSKIAL